MKDEYIKKLIEEIQCEIPQVALIFPGEINDVCVLRPANAEPPTIEDINAGMLVDNEVMPVAVGDIDSIINELNALSDKNDEDLTKQVDALIECKNTIQKLADKMKGNGDKLVNNEIMLAKAIEILYNMQPVFEYHNVRVKYFNELKNNAIANANTAQYGQFLRDNIYDFSPNDIATYLQQAQNALAIQAAGVKGGLKQMYKEYSDAVEIYENDILTVTVSGDGSITNKLNGNIAFNAEFSTLPYTNATAEPIPSITTKSYANSDVDGGYKVIIESPGKVFTKKLYDDYYIKFNTPIKSFFSEEERGVTSTIGFADKDIMSRGPMAKKFISSTVDPVNLVSVTQDSSTFYVTNDKKYQDFTSAFPDKFKVRSKEVFDATIKPTLDMMTNACVLLAKIEARQYVVNDLMQSGSVDTAIQKSAGMVAKYEALLKDIEDLTNARDASKSDISVDKITAELKEVPCVKDNFVEMPTELPEQKIDVKFMPRTTDDFPKDEFPPAFPKVCYWVKYSKLATIYGLTPLPDTAPKAPGSGLRYWPVGFIIPTPSGLIKIPLPVVWIPIVVISLPMGTIVVFVSLCGIFPAPFVLFLSNTGIKEFVITPRGPSGKVGMGDEDAIKKNLMIPLRIPGLAGAFGELEKLALIDFLKGESWDEFLKKNVTSPISDAIDKIGIPQLPAFQLIKLKIEQFKDKINKAGKKIEDFSADADALVKEAVVALEKDMIAAIDKIDLPSFTIPPDIGVLKQESNIKQTIRALKDLAKLKLDYPKITLTDLRERIIKKLSEAIDDPLLHQELLNLPDPIEFNNPLHMEKFLKFVTDIIQFALEKISVDALLYSNLIIPSVAISNPFKCKDSITTPPVDLTKIAAMAAAIGAIKVAMQSITGPQLISFTGMPKLNLSMVLSLAIGIIKTYVPPIILPDIDFSDTHLKNTIKQIKDQISKIGMPKISLVDILGAPREVDLDILKEPIKGLVRIATPNIGLVLPVKLAIDGNLGIEGVNGVAIKAALKNIVIGGIETIVDPIEMIYNAVQMYKAFRNWENNPLDIAMSPVESAKGTALAIAKNLIKGQDVMIPVEKLLEIAFELLDVLPPIPYPVVSIACAFGGTEAIRIVHPILQHEELPEWNKLSLDNFLFCLFLDEFCHNGKKYGGFFENYSP